MNRKKSRKNSIWIPCILCLTGLLDLLAVFMPGFADAYRKHVFHILGSVYSRITGIFPFSVGEIMIILGILWLLFLVLILFLRLFKRVSPLRFQRYLRITLSLLTVLALIMSLNCFILYRASDMHIVRRSDGSLAEVSSEDSESCYTQEKLTSLRDYLVSECNRRAESVLRDENGNVVFAGVISEDDESGLVSSSVRSAIAKEVITSMQSLSEDYPLLSGYYPFPKPLFSSWLMSQMSMEGYYFPFSMEANYNRYMTVCNYASCMAHELSHLKGYLSEDDCNMLAFLACLESDDPAVVYSGYLSVLYYVDNDFYASIGKNKELYNSHEAISEQVRKDNTFLVPEIREAIEKTSPLSTEKVTRTTQVLTDATLKANGVSSGWNNYNEVVKLLLEWYVE